MNLRSFLSFVRRTVKDGLPCPVPGDCYDCRGPKPDRVSHMLRHVLAPSAPGSLFAVCVGAAEPGNPLAEWLRLDRDCKAGRPDEVVSLVRSYMEGVFNGRSRPTV